jgi:hypothetical protein
MEDAAMLKDLISAVKDTYSGAAARQHVAAISQYHRIQASPGFRAAAEYCLSQLRSWGLEAEVLSFPANEHTTYWAWRMFSEWDASEATLDLVQPDGSRRLADYREDKISLIQRSLPFDGEVEVAVLEPGASEENYESAGVAGKVVLAQGDIREVYRLAVQERGAVGILYDGMDEAPPVRQRIDLPDARQYTSFWWYPGDEPKCFGFVLSPRQGDELRALAQRRQEKGEGPLRVRARVASRLYDGQIEVVSALIPGQTAEQVVIVAHLCHPQPSANDNASGAGAALEAARTVRTLIDAGRLPQLRRGIRFLWVPEMTGTCAYLATHEEERARMVAGINLDMVGQDQTACGSSFLIERPPEALASFAGDLAEALRDALQEGAASLGGTATYPLYRQAVIPFSGGSDHYILSDPTVGVPTPMLIQWPDRFYHTSADTVDKVDPRMLATTGRLATAYACFAAAAGEREARWLARVMVARARGALARLAQERCAEALAAGEPAALGQIARRAVREIAFWAGRAEAGLGSLSRLAPGVGQVAASAAWEVHAAAGQERLALEEELVRLAQELGVDALPAEEGEVDEWASRAEKLVLRRLFRGPIWMGEMRARLDPADRVELRALVKAHSATTRALPELMLCWIDGRRSLREIADLVECEAGKRNVELVVRLAGLMERAGLLEQVKGSAGTAE